MTGERFVPQGVENLKRLASQAVADVLESRNPKDEIVGIPHTPTQAEREDIEESFKVQPRIPDIELTDFKALLDRYDASKETEEF